MNTLLVLFKSDSDKLDCPHHAYPGIVCIIEYEKAETICVILEYYVVTGRRIR